MILCKLEQQRHNECIQAAEDALDLYLDLKDPYAEAFELCCMAQWFMNYSRWQLALDHAEDAWVVALCSRDLSRWRP